ncbi:MAR-binding filament-like protein 1 isoform X1 [Magnolia sinica]|uniref:MAR-binding filament-like protein 1 isoform X1 n=1 Tax=Magnolia sinica TaxID=86752 RepID=UPI00265ABF42|nr:MAR-binding filament-like protein 1 isoform X1 [Magnolia sinica]
MEEYLQNMKNLRSQMNDFENEAANVSVEEEKLKTEIQAMENDILSAQSETKRLKQETDEMVKTKGEICCRILEKQKKIASLETESSTLSQTLELLQQEKVNLSAKIKEKRTFYGKVMEEMSVQLQERQDWFNSHMPNREDILEGTIRSMLIDYRKGEEIIDGETGTPNTEMHPIKGNLDSLAYETNEKYKDLIAQSESAKYKLKETIAKKSKYQLENSETKHITEQLKRRLNEFPPELKAMDIEALEEEHKALLSDKAGEVEYLQSLQERIEQIKGISQAVKCRCGQEYTVEMS